MPGYVKTEPSLPVFVLSLFDTGLNTLRILRKLTFTGGGDIELHGFDHVVSQPGLRTGAGATHLLSSSNTTDVLEGLIQLKVKLGARLVVLIPAADIYVRFISDNEALLRGEGFLFFQPPPAIANRFLYRYCQLQAISNINGIDVPRFSRHWSEHSDLQFPIFVRGDDEELWRQRFGTKGRCFERQADLEGFLDESPEWLNGLIFQEVIDGGATFNYEVSYIVDRLGQVVAFFVMQKLAQLPARFGTGVRGRAVKDPSLLAIFRQKIESIVAATGFYGIGNTEFKYCPIRRRWFYIETNLRVWQQIDLASAVGVPFIPQLLRLACEGEVELPAAIILDSSSQERVTQNDGDLLWVDPIRSLYHDLQGAPTFVERLRVLVFDWPRSLREAVALGPLVRKDLRPFLWPLLHRGGFVRVAVKIFMLLFFPRIFATG